MRKSYLLKYASFILMLTAVVRLFFGLMMMNFFTTASNMRAVDPDTMLLATVAIILIIASFLADLASGFIGALHWNEPLKAGTCTVMGAVCLGLGIAGNLVQGATGYGISEVAWTTGAIIPGIFLAAALFFLIRRSVYTGPEGE
ncbi:MAG: hypothetical protein J6Z23_06430 [Lachnospiraceae bacterium]|nr:hypothetical protein [Lachnospiraceae bacterium]